MGEQIGRRAHKGSAAKSLPRVARRHSAGAGRSRTKAVVPPPSRGYTASHCEARSTRRRPTAGGSDGYVLAGGAFVLIGCLFAGVSCADPPLERGEGTRAVVSMQLGAELRSGNHASAANDMSDRAHRCSRADNGLHDGEHGDDEERRGPRADCDDEEHGNGDDGDHEGDGNASGKVTLCHRPPGNPAKVSWLSTSSADGQLCDKCSYPWAHLLVGLTSGPNWKCILMC